MNVFERIGATPIINALGIYTKLGGTIISPTVWQAMTEANDWAVEMSDLLDASGEHLAKFLGVEAARVVPGVAAGLPMSLAACLIGQDPSAVERLPDTTGLRSGVVVQAAQQYKYLRACWLSGAHPVWAGTDERTTAEDLEKAFADPSVFAAVYPAHLEPLRDAVALADFAAIAHAHDIPVIIDAAFMSYPPTQTTRYAGIGDVVLFSAKYFYGPNGGGFAYGRPDLIEAIGRLDFTAFETSEWRTFGRSFKLDRHTVVATILALEEWFAMDHEERWGKYRRMVRTMEEALKGRPGIQALPKYFAPAEGLEDEPVNCLVVRVDPARAGIAVEELHQALYDGPPRIVAHLEDGEVIICVESMREGQDTEVATRLAAILG